MYIKFTDYRHWLKYYAKHYNTFVYYNVYIDNGHGYVDERENNKIVVLERASSI